MINKCNLITHEQTKSFIAEAYRTLRTNIHFSKGDKQPKTILFTSAAPGEGKSTTVANTAVSLAQAGNKVIVMDCDLRKPVQHRFFGRNYNGLTNLLTEHLPVEDLLQKTAVENLWLLSSGPIPPNPSELLGSKKMQKVLDYARKEADYVIIDTPPILAVTDACVLASKVDGVILVVGAGMIRPEMAQKAKELLENVKGHLLGVVLNRVELEQGHYYYYYGSYEQLVAKGG